MAVLAFLISSVGVTLFFGVVPPPVTPLMLIRGAEQWLDGKPMRLSKDWTPLDEISPRMVEAVVAAEDQQFFEHRGFDWESILAAFAINSRGKRKLGASTITQQTAKNLFLWPDRSLLRKALEAPLTPQIEVLWPKRRIIEVYLNIVEFGPGIYGAEAAAQSYFGKSAAELSSREAALLAAVLPSPRTSSPAHPSAWLERRAETIRSRIGQLGPMLDCVRAS
jgi:monofunctional biosynthetic peptidoglycan transglycosylase